MLVVTRKVNESVMIGDDIVLTVVRIGADKVRLGVTAPRGVPIHREEIWQEIQLASAGTVASTAEPSPSGDSCGRCAGDAPTVPRSAPAATGHKIHGTPNSKPIA